MGKAEDWESQMIDGRWWEREWERASGIFFVLLNMVVHCLT